MLKSFDFDAAVQAPFRMQPGLRRLASGMPQLTPVGAGSRHQREKLAVLSAFPERALVRAARIPQSNSARARPVQDGASPRLVTASSQIGDSSL